MPSLSDKEREAGMRRLRRQFMTPDVTEGIFFHVESKEGETTVTPDMPTSEEQAAAESVEAKRGWYARLSAAGYLDCTDWNGPFPSEQAAETFLVETYADDVGGEDEEDGEDVEEGEA